MDDRGSGRPARDENRYEIVDGHLLVTPPPPLWHQTVGSRLLVQLAKACPDDWEAVLRVHGRLRKEVSVHPFRLEGGTWQSEPIVDVRGSVPVPWGTMVLDLQRLRD